MEHLLCPRAMQCTSKLYVIGDEYDGYGENLVGIFMG